jgi:hypothetical protein
MPIIEQDIISWLEEQRSEVWHAIGDNWNWDYGLDPLIWLVQQPECDAGTARSVFWTCYLSDPTVADFSPESRDLVEKWCGEEQELFALIGKNAFNGLYKTNRFKCTNDDTASRDGPIVAKKLELQREQGHIDWRLSEFLLESGNQGLKEIIFEEEELYGIETAEEGGFEGQ